LASHTPDDGFHEIQLNGKQLVFLFMAATVVSVVIFLCGVLVGRGVRAERASALADQTAAAIEPAPQAASAPVSTPAGSDPTAAAAPPPTADDLSYFNRLEKQTQPAENLKAAAAPVAPPPAAPAPVPAPPPPARAVVKETPAPKTPAPKVVPEPKAPAVAASAASAPPAGEGYVIQVAAMKEHGDADAMAKRLSSKGYSAFVMAPGAAGPAMYRVRVGKFKTKREAETVAARLQSEEQFKPWITR
jgi:cell division septation protein DedD